MVEKDTFLRMLEDSFSILIIIYVLILSVQVLQAHSSSPSCRYYKLRDAPQKDGSYLNGSILSNTCQLTKQTGHCLSLVSLDENISNPVKYVWSNKSKHDFINVTVHHSKPSTADRFLIQERPTGTCWSVQIAKDENPSKISVTHLPVSNNFTEVIAAAILSDAHGHHSCSHISCSTFYNFTGLDIVPVPAWKMVKLKLAVKEEADYKIALLFGECDITCEGYENGCIVNITNDSVHLKPDRAYEKDFGNQPPGYFCARIIFSNCCVIHTETIKLEAVSPKPDVLLVRDPMPFYAIPVIIALVTLTSIILLFIAKPKLYSIIRRLTPSMKQPESTQEECTTTLIPESLIYQSILDMKDSVQIYLAYYDESDYFLELMSSFRRLLSCYVEKVWDPFSNEDIEDVSRSLWNWVEKTFSNPKVKIVLVETEKAVLTEKQWVQDKTLQVPHHQHFLNKVFFLTMAHIKNDIRLAQNYSRIFIVRLSSSNSSDSEFNILPYTRYQMIDNFETLIYNMSRHISSNTHNNEDYLRIELPSQEKDDFNMALTRYYSFN